MSQWDREVVNPYHNADKQPSSRSQQQCSYVEGSFRYWKKQPQLQLVLPCRGWFGIHAWRACSSSSSPHLSFQRRPRVDGSQQVEGGTLQSMAMVWCSPCFEGLHALHPKALRQPITEKCACEDTSASPCWGC